MQISQLEQRLRDLSQYISNNRERCECPCVLIAEDDEFIRLVNRTKFMTLGFEVKDVGNGALAVEAMEEQEQACTQCEGFLIVLMDYDMPVMNGVEATRKIRALIDEGKVSDIPIVAVSAFVASQEVERCLNSGMNDYITKPFTQQRLLSVLLQYMTQKLLITQRIKQNEQQSNDDEDMSPCLGPQLQQFS